MHSNLKTRNLIRNNKMITRRTKNVVQIGRYIKIALFSIPAYYFRGNKLSIWRLRIVFNRNWYEFDAKRGLANIRYKKYEND